MQASKDCVQKTIKRLEEKIQGKVLHQILYAMYSSDRAVQQRVATALARLAAPSDLKTVRPPLWHCPGTVLVLVPRS